PATSLDDPTSLHDALPICVQVTIKNPSNLTATSSVNVTVNQTLTGISVSPSNATVPVGGTKQFTATATDQFSTALASQPSFAWAVSGGGTITSAGLFTPDGTGSGPYTVMASSAGVSGTATVTVTGSTSGISYVQGASTTSNVSATSISQAFPAVNGSGNLIVVAVSWGNSSSVTCSDSLANSYAVATTQFDSMN